MGAMKTPGVYIVEKSAFPNSAVEVATAVPVFIGYTEKSVNGGKSLKNKPWRITSLAEYHQYFGGAPTSKFKIEKIEPATEGVPETDFIVKDSAYSLQQTTQHYTFYYNMLMFFCNGGGPCFIISVGNYEEEIEKEKLESIIEELKKEQEPTMLIIPEAVCLKAEDCFALQQTTMKHCGMDMRNRIAILDVYNGFKPRNHPDGDCIASFREGIGKNFLDFSVAYYPWLNTSIVQDRDLSFENIEDPKSLAEVIREEHGIKADATSPVNEELKKLDDISVIDSSEKGILNKTLAMLSPTFNTIIAEMKKKLNLLPPAAAMAGVYTMVDNTRGVWKAPANVSVAGVIAPVINITHEQQEDLNVTILGKSINAIRPFIGEGTIVWGARTLDGNSLDWRYINVRRTILMLEESIKLAAKAFVFENNTANTWITVKGMIDNFLTGIWKRGGLAGSSPADAFEVHIGLGDTMTPEDILEGIMRITVLVALIRPAEFIEITFQQQMQKS
ncbi:MAG: phage tail sheath family protein [Chitinispirillaceae bacterium]|nr:phage tail sheath family protein [Chitinispirillaceae bacterium]